MADTKTKPYKVQQVVFMADTITLDTFDERADAELFKATLEKKNGGGMDIYSYYEIKNK